MLKKIAKIANIVCFGVMPYLTKVLRKALANAEAGKPAFNNVF